MSNTDDTNKTNPVLSDLKKLLDELSSLEQVKPSCHSFWIPIAALAIIALLLFLPLKCSAQTMCNCSNKGDTLVDKQATTIQFYLDVPSILKELQYDTSENKQKYVVKSDKITIQPYEKKSELWPLLLYRLLAAVILLLATIFMLKYLVPYWKKIVEVNEKHNERLMKIAEEQIEFSRLKEKTDINIEERKEKNNMDDVIREKDHQRKLSLMEKEHKHQEAMKAQEYKSQLSTAVSDMVKTIGQSPDVKNAEIIKMMLEMLKP